MQKFRLVLSYDDPYVIYLFVNILIRRRYFESRDDGLTNIYLVFYFLTELWLKWKKSFREATFFRRRFHFCISFINFLTKICVDEVILKL